MSGGIEDIAEGLRKSGLLATGHLTRMDAIRAAGKLPKRELGFAYTGAYLSFFTKLELSIEDLFIGLMTGRLKHPDRRVRGSLPVRDRSIAISLLLLDNKKYLDWLPFDRTLSRAKTLLVKGRPFIDVPNTDITFMKKTYALRNALAHQSKHSREQYAKQWLSNAPIPGNTPPEKFLALWINSDQRYVDWIMAELVRIFREMTEARKLPVVIPPNT